MEDGFEGTSIRKIMNEAGAEVGLFYYYFKSKDDIYSAFIESLFIDYKIKIIGMTEKAVRSPYTSLLIYSDCLRMKLNASAMNL